MRSAVRALLLLMVFPWASSCVGPEIVATAGLSAAQAGVSEFNRGRLTTAWYAPIGTMRDAVLASLTELGYPSAFGESVPDEWHVYAEELDGTPIDIYLTRSSSRVTIVSIRIGVLGSQPLSRLIADTIDRQLKVWIDAKVVPASPPKEH